MSGSAAPTCARFDYDLYFDLLLVSKKQSRSNLICLFGSASSDTLLIKVVSCLSSSIWTSMRCSKVFEGEIQIDSFLNTPLGHDICITL